MANNKSHTRAVGLGAGDGDGDGDGDGESAYAVLLADGAPDVNPVESLWSTLKSSLGNLAVDTLDQLTAILRNRLQYRPDLIPSLLTQTGLSLNPEPEPS